MIKHNEVGIQSNNPDTSGTPDTLVPPDIAMVFNGFLIPLPLIPDTLVSLIPWYPLILLQWFPMVFSPRYPGLLHIVGCGDIIAPYVVLEIRSQKYVVLERRNLKVH